LRKERDAGRDPETMVKRIKEGRVFHIEDPIVANDLCHGGPNLQNKESVLVQRVERCM